MKDKNYILVSKTLPITGVRECETAAVYVNKVNERQDSCEPAGLSAQFKIPQQITVEGGRSYHELGSNLV